MTLATRRRPESGAGAARPAAAAAETDAESGQDEASDMRRSLAALDAMRWRGLIDEAEYTLRRRDLLGYRGEG